MPAQPEGWHGPPQRTGILAYRQSARPRRARCGGCCPPINIALIKVAPGCAVNVMDAGAIYECVAVLLDVQTNRHTRWHSGRGVSITHPTQLQPSPNYSPPAVAHQPSSYLQVPANAVHWPNLAMGMQHQPGHPHKRRQHRPVMPVLRSMCARDATGAAARGGRAVAVVRASQ